MADIGYAAALLLAGLFSWAGLVKLRARTTTARTFRAFGLVAPEALAVGVPVVELVLAVGLVFVPAWAALAAIAVLAAFTTILLRAMAAGVDVGCGCFGTTRREPVSFVEIVRNGLLAVAATVAAFAPAPTVPDLGAVIVVTTAAVAGAGVLALCDRRRPPRPQLGSEGPDLDAPAPLAGAFDHGGRTSTLMVFTAPTCEACVALRPALPDLGRRHRGLGMHILDLDDSTRPTFTAFDVRSTPYVVVVDGTGIVRAKGAADSPGQVEALLAEARRRSGPATADTTGGST